MSEPAAARPGGALEVVLVHTGADGGRRERPLGGAGRSGAVVLAGGHGLELRLAGLEPGEPVTVTIGAHEVEVVADERGAARHAEPGLLRATAGRVELRVERASGEALGAALELQPTRLATDALRVLLDELDALAVGLWADLGGHGQATRQVSPAEATLQALEEAVGPLEEAVALTARRLLRRTWQEVRAVPSPRGVTSARDARWLASHPHLAVSAGARGLEVGVHRRQHDDLHVPENQGVAMLMQRLEGLATTLLALLDAEAARIEAGRPAREAFRTTTGNLYLERDAPRLRSIAARAERLRALLGQVTAARARLRLPAELRPAPFIRSPQVETHPGYWRLHRIWQQVAPLDLSRPAPAVAPLRNTDELYELWCALVVARSLAHLARRKLADLVGPALGGWFRELPRGCLLSVPLGGWDLRLHYEPAIPWRPAEGASLAKLHPGRPWRPDLLLEVRAGGQLVEVHVLDAKHSLDPADPRGVPRKQLDEVWLKYPDSIGDPRTRIPVVASCWILYPGPVPHVHLRSPAMLDPAWPTDRVRGGAIALCPGRPDTVEALGGVLEALLRR